MVPIISIGSNDNNNNNQQQTKKTGRQYQDVNHVNLIPSLCCSLPQY